tara:strand:+ start:905 stop:1267 length:363 start_codon:yes stop_codon:yes gene_type:complete
MNNLYDVNNIFAKILRSEVPCEKILENEHALAISDINPQAPIHKLIIPKNPYINFYDFIKNASIEEHESFWKLVNDVIEHFKVETEGFRIITNSGKNGNQDVPHFHIHLLGGENLGKMIG